MPAFELTIKANSFADLAEGVATLHERFRDPEDGAPPAGLAGYEPPKTARTAAGRRKRGLLEDVSAAQNQGVAGGAPAAEDTPDRADAAAVGSPAAGEAGAVDAQQAAAPEDQGEGQAGGAGAQAPGDGGGDSGEAAADAPGVDVDAAAPDAVGGGESPVAQQSAPSVAEGVAQVQQHAPSLEDVRRLAQQLIEKKGLTAGQEACAAAGVAKINATLTPDDLLRVKAEIERRL